jgi:hypothetical protein
MSATKQAVKFKRLSIAALLCLGACLAQAQGASAAEPPKAKWSLQIDAEPASFASGATGSVAEDPENPGHFLIEGAGYRILATNAGSGATTEPYEIRDVLPAGVLPVSGEVIGEYEYLTENAKKEHVIERGALSCETLEQEVSCTGTEPLADGASAEVIIPLEVATGISGASLLDQASVEGGGAAPTKATLRTAVGLPAWKFTGVSGEPTNVTGGGNGVLFVYATNVGGAGSTEPTTITATLPEGLTPTGQVPAFEEKGRVQGAQCSLAAQTFTCVNEGTLPPGGTIFLQLAFKADLVASGTLLSQISVEGGGASPQASTIPVTVSPTIAPFGFLPGEGGFSAPLTSADGTAATQAGSHPNQLTIEMAFPSEQPSPKLVTGAEEPHDAIVDLPPGEILNPTSPAARCTEAQLNFGNCPEDSQIGIVTATVGLGGLGVAMDFEGIYNMVAAPHTPSTFAFNAAGEGLLIHIEGGLRSDGDYGLSGASRDIFARGIDPALGLKLTFWGDPSSSAHDAGRNCNGEAYSCPAEGETKTALLTAPVQCSGQPTITRARTDSWEHIGIFKSASYESADLAGTPVATNGCNQLQYEPSIEAKPTTNLADSPSGLNVDIHQPVNEDPGGISPAMMKDIRLVLPKGMSVNPSSAEGLGYCPEAQAHLHSLTPGECPDDSKLGPAEVITPLLDHPVTGALYLAQPLKNPTGSLIATYLELSDPSTGTVSNLAGKVEADPLTGQLTSVFEQNPQLPLEQIRAHLFTGPRAALRTPAACGNYASRADMVPWSAPQTAVAHPTDPWAVQANPNGGSCPQQGQSLPSNPSFAAGTIDPQAAAYTPFVFKLTRQDDTQEIQKIDTTLPPGLAAKLAGVPYCPEAGIQRAQSRSNPNEGVLEQNDPSCPASSKVGVVKVASGAGITPLHVQGNAYLAGPYKGAPLSLVVITPAIAGPFDLGTVVVRIALHVDPETAKVTGVSDPLPTILYGIPLDIRQIALELDRSQFTLNPTSCDPMSVGGTLTTALGTTSPLSVPFQVGGCSSLAFKPSLAIRLKGGTTRGAHPALTASLSFPAGQNANVKTAQVSLPHSEFLDQAHIGTVCTRVQFAANACPAKSIYGKASATSPLLGAPLSGPVYLRSSSHELPDLVVALHGQVDVTLDGRIDSINGGIRTTFEDVPDAPVSKFTLQMQGGKKGLLVNSTNLCRHPKANKAISLMEGQNGKVYDTEPLLTNSCKKPKAKNKRHHKRKSAR